MDPILVSLHTHLHTYFASHSGGVKQTTIAPTAPSHLVHVVVNSAHGFVIAQTPRTPGREGLDNPLTPNDPYRGCTAPLTSKSFILYIYSTNIGTEYFKHGIQSPFFFLFKMQFVS